MSSKCSFKLTSSAARELSVDFVANEKTTRVDFRLLPPTPDDVSLSWSAEAQAVAGLIPAMRTGARLLIDRPLESTFLRNLGTAQAMLSMWFTDLHRIDVDAVAMPPRVAVPATRQALFFGGGVDSMFSLLRHADSITDLVYVHGFDVPLAETALRSVVSAYLREVAVLFGVNVIEIETDLRPFLDTHASWLATHGAALAVIAHLFPRSFSHIYIPSTYSYDKLQPCGTHPLLDPLWSTTAVEFVHDGADTTRADKTATVARHADARRLLRVCWSAPRADRLNCCRCEKCLRTMVALQAAGELHAGDAFRLPLEYGLVRAIQLDAITRDLWHQNLALLVRTGIDPKLLATVERLLKPNLFKRLKRRIRTLNRQRIVARRQVKLRHAGDASAER